MHYLPFQSGGQQLYVHELLAIARQLGKDAMVIQPDRGIERPEYVMVTPAVRGLRFLGPHASWFWFTAALHRYRKVLTKADAVISHYSFHYPGIPQAAPSIVLSHGVDWPEKPRKIVDRYKLWISKKCARERVPVVANDTDYLRRVGITNALGHKPYSMVNDYAWYIPNAVDTQRYCPVSSVRDDTILVPRNIRKSRGIHLAIEAYSVYRALGGRKRLVFAGGRTAGPYYEECLSRMRKHDLQDHVVFLGEVEHPNMLDLYRRAAITLVPTIAFEGTSYSALEAMACGCPTVSTMVGGLSDLPTVKCGTDAHSMAESLLATEYQAGSIAVEQRQQVEYSFDIKQWRAAWRSVLEWRMS